MVSIPTGIPQYWKERWDQYWRQALLTRLWQALLVITGALVIYAALSSGVLFIVTVTGIALSVILADDIKQTVTDIWNRNFWVWKP